MLYNSIEYYKKEKIYYVIISHISYYTTFYNYIGRTNMSKIRIGIVGYGNLGRGVEASVKLQPDMELVGVFLVVKV